MPIFTFIYNIIIKSLLLRPLFIIQTLDAFFSPAANRCCRYYAKSHAYFADDTSVDLHILMFN